MLEALAWTQGAYYAASGVWALVHLPSFEAVTGPKRDKWLVKTVGVLVAVIGAALCSSAWSGAVSDPIILLAAGSALGLAAIDITYSLKRVISSIYLADAAVEIVLAGLWLYARGGLS